MFFRTLYGKLAITLIGLLAAVGISYVLLTASLTSDHLKRTSQELNRTLAANLIKERALVSHGRLDHSALKGVFESFMVINPSIELYLLDEYGVIEGYSAPKGKVVLTQVALEPIRRFLAGDTLPILGDDPRDMARKKIFSAAPLDADDPDSGYLYVVLHGENYDSISDVIGDSYILRLGSWVIVASLITALILGLFLINQFTRRLTRLSQVMADFERNDFSRLPADADFDYQSNDEIGRLGSSFRDLANRVISQLKALRETDRHRRDMVANISHDLRTPLASLQGYLETLLLKEGSLSPDKQREYLEIALRHSTRLGKLTKDLFELTRLDAGDIKPQKVNFSIHELVYDILQKYQLDAEKRGIHLSCSDADTVCSAYGDIGLIERALENLIENALRHSSEGGNVRVDINEENKSVRLTVSDNGKGIPAEEIPHIFSRFYQVDKHRSNKFGGAGLGLAIVKSILDLHSSTISVKSAPGQGTQFSFVLKCSDNQHELALT